MVIGRLSSIVDDSVQCKPTRQRGERTHRIRRVDFELFVAVAKKDLGGVEMEVDARSAATVMLVSGGYPGAYAKGKEILGLDQVQDSIVFHAGTAMKDDKVLTSGGRVLAITSFGNDFREALRTSYENIEKISFDEMNFRRDIGFDL